MLVQEQVPVLRERSVVRVDSIDKTITEPPVRSHWFLQSISTLPAYLIWFGIGKIHGASFFG